MIKVEKKRWKKRKIDLWKYPSPKTYPINGDTGRVRQCERRSRPHFRSPLDDASRLSPWIIQMLQLFNFKPGSIAQLSSSIAQLSSSIAQLVKCPTQTLLKLWTNLMSEFQIQLTVNFFDEKFTFNYLLLWRIFFFNMIVYEGLKVPSTIFQLSDNIQYIIIWIKWYLPVVAPFDQSARLKRQSTQNE